MLFAGWAVNRASAEGGGSDGWRVLMPHCPRRSHLSLSGAGRPSLAGREPGTCGGPGPAAPTAPAGGYVVAQVTERDTPG